MHEDGSWTGWRKVFGSADDSKRPEKRKETTAENWLYSKTTAANLYVLYMNAPLIHWCVYTDVRCVTYCKYRDIIFVPVHFNTIEKNKIFQNKEVYKYTTDVTVCVRNFPAHD